MSNDFNIVERTPCLPLKFFYSSYDLDYNSLKSKINKFGDTEITEILANLSQHNRDKYIKYVRRASYRTAFAGKFVRETLYANKTSKGNTSSMFLSVAIERKIIYVNPYSIFDGETYS